MKSNSDYKTRRYLTLFVCNVGLRPGSGAADAERGCSSRWPQGVLPSPEPLRNQKVIKHHKIYSTKNWQDGYLWLQSLLYPGPHSSPTRQCPLTSPGALLGANKVAKPGLGLQWEVPGAAEATAAAARRAGASGSRQVTRARRNF